MTTLASRFAALRAEAKLSYADIANRCAPMSRHVVWKLENGKPIKASTLGKILRRGLRIRENTPAYLELFALWSAEQSRSPQAPDVQRALRGLKVGNDARFTAFAAEVLELVRDLPEADRPHVLEALRITPALKLWLASRR